MTGLRSLYGSLSALVLCVVFAFAMPSDHAQGKRHGRATRGMDCATCHSPAGWGVKADLKSTNSAGFDHDLTGFPLRAMHANAACTQCHDGREAVSRDCASCHEDNHQGKLGTACDQCHTAISFQATDTFKIHSRTRLPLTGMHVLVDCVDCHRRMSSEGYASTPSQCFACHEDDYRRPDVHPVHDGSGGAAAFPRNCAECHRTSGFVPAVIDANRFLAGQAGGLNFDLREHDRDFVLSRGAHRGAPCNSCHVDLRAPRMTRCTGCHAHDTASLAVQHKRTGTPGDGSCLACHAGGLAR